MEHVIWRWERDNLLPGLGPRRAATTAWRTLISASASVSVDTSSQSSARVKTDARGIFAGVEARPRVFGRWPSVALAAGQ